MPVLFDTNVIIDAITMRDYSYHDSKELVLKVAKGSIDGYISAKQVTDIYYILRKYTSNEAIRKELINMVVKTFKILPTLASDIKIALSSPIEDFEDAIIEEEAKVNTIQMIVTNNVKHFEKSKLSIFTPSQLNQITNTDGYC